ncbi:MAG: hypothetical protein FD148_1395 [Methylocystaceae bacterium]|nr:MAG: hypothetical protein FD148_1395 [Methylocystaceae bacterium]
MGAANAGEHGRNMPLTRIERRSELPVAPADAGEPSLQRGDRNRRATPLAAHTSGEIKADGLRVRGQRVEPLAAQPGGKLPPVGVIGAPGVVRAGVAGVIAGLFGERSEMGGGGPFCEGRLAALERIVDVSHLVPLLTFGWGSAPFERKKSDASVGMMGMLRLRHGTFQCLTGGAIMRLIR